MTETIILEDVSSITRYFANLILDKNEIKQIKVSTKSLRRVVHEEAEKLGLRAQTLYQETDRRQRIRCNNCKKITTIINGQGSRNACCSECDCTQQCVDCANCEDGEDELGRIYWDFMDSEEKAAGKYAVKQFYGPSDQMIIRHANTPYKHLNTKNGSYRRSGNRRPDTSSGAC